MEMEIIWNGNGNYLTNINDIGMEMVINPEMVIRIKRKLHGFKWKIEWK